MLTIVTVIGGLLDLPTQAAIQIEPRNVAVPCAPGTRFIFRPFFDPNNQRVPGIWTITAIDKSGKTATSGTFNPDNHVPGNDAFTHMVDLCIELAQPGAGAALARRLVATGLDPSDVVLGDFNGDGLPDLAIANQGSNNVSVALGTPGGGFGPTVNFPAGTGPVRMEVGDFNGDGKQDLITANIGTGLAGNLTLLLGNGDGTFQAPIAIAAGTLPVDLVVGDWNGDGTLDLGVADNAASVVVVRLGRGGGSFQPPVSLPTGSFSTASIVADSLSVFLNAGGGGITGPVTVVVGKQPTRLAAGDFNHDGKVDLVVANNGDFGQGNGSIEVRLGNGDGTFAAGPVLRNGIEPDSVAVGDVDGDGRLDVVAVV